jgi:NADH:ubiquinone oxidoreductase subunit C
MGIKFNNHPKLERILLPKDILYHSLRKDFKGGG